MSDAKSINHLPFQPTLLMPLQCHGLPRIGQKLPIRPGVTVLNAPKFTRIPVLKRRCFSGTRLTKTPERCIDPESPKTLNGLCAKKTLFLVRALSLSHTIPQRTILFMVFDFQGLCIFKVSNLQVCSSFSMSMLEKGYHFWWGPPQWLKGKRW